MTAPTLGMGPAMELSSFTCGCSVFLNSSWKVTDPKVEMVEMVEMVEIL